MGIEKQGGREREKERGGLPSEGRERPYFYGRLQSRGRERDKCGR
jgi:hypothetical protein